ncbi:uncharacterized protein LOC119595729 [Penaeus monodon]|uniref:uncharacterized protein LOC119595729 n=1 Tax=Penaeus monodon TaxID=6687 RepID=UPI0018A75551|nr:uncharacterized protein LOC119595729 [Penaeus monodon]
MARGNVVALLVVAACLVAAVTTSASNRYNQFGFGHGIGQGFGNYGQVYPGNYNPAFFPNLVSGYNFYNYQPASNYQGCTYWCRSLHPSRFYYCCTTGYEG